jgi:hypothetical protein
MASSSLSRTKPRDYRPALLSLAQRYARQAAIAQIRAKGHKVCDYLPKDITRMGMALLMQEPEPFFAKVREVIAEWIANSRSPVPQSLPVNQTHAQNGAQQ